MPNTQRMSQPMVDWSTEISAPQSAVSAAAGAAGAFQYPPAPMPADAPPAFQFPPDAGTAEASGGASALPAGTASPTGPVAPENPPSSVPAVRPANRHPAHNEFAGSTGELNLQHHQPAEIIEAPTSTGEAFVGSLKAMLLRNRGNFVAATLLIGTQGTMVWEGILHEVGNDYFIIYQTGRQRYILCDIYALKYMEFYDTRQRELCEHLLQGNSSKGFC
ncbi:MAG: hypothetical protein K2L38_06315 [Dysosmobacter sp.]|nr:hypothetical protein [Dysosmobacter sp.]